MISSGARPREEVSRRAASDEVCLLGVRFDRLNRKDALEILASALGRGEARKVYIVNAHTLNLAWSDRTYRRILNEADILLNDGTGVQFASRLAGKPFLDNLVGTDLAPQLCEIAADRGVGVFLLGGAPGTPEKAADRLKQLVPGVVISGLRHGYFRPGEEPGIVDAITASNAGILLVALGNPLQERWIYENAPRLRCDLCIAVGGLFDHWSGRLRRAPAWMRRAGIEWVQILLQQPSKWRRYVLGNPAFVARAIMDRVGWPL